MLQIRGEQLRVFSAGRLEEFLTRLSAHLREHFPERLGGETDESLRRYGLACIDRAAGYGLTHEQAVACYAHLPLVLGDDFEANPRYRFAVVLLGARDRNQDTRAKVAVAIAYNLKARGI